VAAHAAGLVHCDFKPGNVLVDKDGIVRVGDFGLARTVRRTTEPRSRASQVTVDLRGGSVAGLTVAGTPAYMAPEQFDGVATPESDQFAFCVALWEALAGERPHADATIDSHTGLAMEGVRGPRRPPPPAIPPYLARALERGLADEPGARFPSMQALLDALVPPSKLRRYALYAAAAAAVVAGGTVVASRVSSYLERPWDGADVPARRALTFYASRGCASDPVFARGEVVYGGIIHDQGDIYAVPATGGAPRQLTETPTLDWRPNTGRRDGEVVYLRHDRLPEDAAIDALDVAAGRATPLLPHRFAWDAVVADGGLVYSPDNPAGLEIADPDERRLVDPPSGDALLTVAVAPGGDYLAAIETNTNNGPSHVCIVGRHSGMRRCLEPPATEGRPAFGADGTVLYYGYFDGVHRYDRTRERDELIVPAAPVMGGVAVSTDGSLLVYSACAPKSRVEDDTYSRVIEDDRYASQPAVATTGAIAWVRDMEGVGTLVYRDPTGPVRELTPRDFGSVRAPAFDPTGKRIVFSSDNGLYYVKVDEPGARHRISKDGTDSSPKWTADDTIVFYKENVAGDVRVWATRPEGGDARPLGDTTRWVYGVRGNEILVGDESLQWIDTAGNVLTEARPPPNPDGQAPYWASVSPDGRWLAMQTTPQLSDVYVMRLDVPDDTPRLAVHYGHNTTAYRVAIDDAGHIIAAPQVWTGDLFVVPARAGSHF
jgi:hypothetical protein